MLENCEEGGFMYRLIQLVGMSVFLFALALLLPKQTYASHSWGNYHWARTTNPFTLKLGDNVTPTWDGHLATAAADWSVSNVLDLAVVAGSANPKNCRPSSGRVEVCNAKYGKNGWLGIAQIWASGAHIVQGVTKLNDTYFNTATYNSSAWRNLVMCQEVGHTIGLDHQDETFTNANLNTCMDYTNNPESNQYPNAHDYEELEIIYAHLDGLTTVGQTSAQLAQSGFFKDANVSEEIVDEPGSWGQLVRQTGRIAVYERDFGAGRKLLTHVIWAE